MLHDSKKYLILQKETETNDIVSTDISIFDQILVIGLYVIFVFPLSFANID